MMDAVYRAESRPPTAPARFGLSVPLAESHGGVNATYIFLIWELVDRRPVHDVPAKVRRIMRVRSIVTLCLFGDEWPLTRASPNLYAPPFGT